MSLFLFQQKIPFRSVSTFLRVFEPGSQMSPEQFGKAAVEDVTAGDLVFVLEPIYSPWSDSSSGIGVAEGDAFNVSAIVIGYKWESGLLGYVVTEESYERQSVQNYLAQQAHTAKSNRCGFYYAIVRPVTPLSPDVMRDLGELDSFGNSGFRKDENQPIDILYGFATAAGLAVEVQVGQQPDIAQIGYGLFCDKEPAPGSNVPDFRGLVEPIAKDQRREPEALPSDLAKPDAPPPVPAAPAPQPVAPAPQPVAPAPQPTAAAQPAKLGLPKMPSFFNKGKQQQQQQDGKSKTPRIIGPAPRTSSQSAAATAGEPAQVGSAPLPLPDDTESGQGFSPLAAWAESSDTEQRPALTAADLGTVEVGAPPPLPGSAGDDHGQTDAGNNDSSAAAKAEQGPPPLPDSGGPPPLPGAPPPLPSTPPPLPQNGGRAGVRLPRSSAPTAMPQGLQPPPLPAGAAPDTVAAERPEPGNTPAQSWSEPESAPSGASAENDIPSLAELLGNISRASQQPEAAPPPSLSDLARAEETAGDDDSERSPAPGGPAAKKKADPSHDLQNRPIKEPITVKSGVAGLVSKLEQQASKASSRLETQVDEIQNRLTEEISELLAKVNSAESRSVRNGQDLRAEMSERMDKATFDISEKIAVAARDGAHAIKEHDQDGSKGLEEKYEYLRTALTNSFEEVKARAEAIARDFEETLGNSSQRSLKDLDQLKDNLNQQLTDLYTHYEKALQESFDAFEKRLKSANTSVSSTLEARYQLLQGQLQDGFQRSGSRLEQWQYTFVNQLNKEFTVARCELRKLRANTMAEIVLPKLQEHREQVRIIISECQSKLAEDLEKKADEKLSAFEPMLVEKRQRLQEMLHTTTAVKDSIAEQLRERLQKIADELKEFVEKGIAQAQTAFKNTEDQLAEIDRAVRQLADQSSIEGDLELLNERNQVLSAMDEANEKAKDEVLSTLRTSLAALEEKGKQLQEELISSMEEDAYRVRRASEQSLNTIRDAIKEAFKAIQSAQDERMPM